MRRCNRALMLTALVLFSHKALHAQAASRNDDGAEKISGVPAYVLRTYQFAADSNTTRLHVRFGIVNDVLQFTQEAGGNYRADYEVNLSVVDREQNLAASRIWKRSLTVGDFAGTNDRQRLNEEQVDFLLAPREYELRVEISDLHTQRRLRRTYPLALLNFNEPRLQLSTLALGAQTAARDTLQYNLLAVLGDEKPEQGVFYEIYGAQAGDTLEAHYLISDWKQEKLDEWRTTIIADNARVRRFEALSPKLTFQGLHRLRVTVCSHAQMAEAEVDYRVQFSSSGEIEAARLLQDYPGLAYLPLRYIASSKEHKRIIAAPPEHRDSLVAEFWQVRDPSAGTAVNELREEFYRRVAFAQTRFALHGIEKAGWETDRGRIYIIFGPPQEVHHQMGELEPTPYEIWFYPKQERRFVFMDKKGSGEYELVNR